MEYLNDSWTPGCILADEMALGKRNATITLLMTNPPHALHSH
jgi:SNF2 family DNA or RNA helicase